MNWTTNLAADLQRPRNKQSAPWVEQRHPTPDTILTPWGWPSDRPARTVSRRKLSALKSDMLLFNFVPVKMSDLSGCVKPWGW